MASINEDIQNIVMDAKAEQILLNDLSGGKVVSQQTSQLSPKRPDTDRNVNHQNNSKEHPNEKQSYLTYTVPKKMYSSACWQMSATSSLSMWFL